ncbi:sensor histidine kinase, partial [Natronoarchaeum mannanilyticum]|uniref:sensor histidine kinase n=1 Tax=Natronoarchaeum mannanilyticum TaxID=926360 RepID=UPI00362304E4
TESVSLSGAAWDAWQGVDTDDATLAVEGDVGTVAADRDRLLELLENLFRNAVEHGSTSPDSQARQDAIEHAHSADDPVTITVGPLESGFFVEDDGPGIPDSEKETVFEQGYTNADDGTGFGLYIVRTLADAHDWAVELADADPTGARFEITGVERGKRSPGVDSGHPT